MRRSIRIIRLRRRTRKAGRGHGGNAGRQDAGVAQG